MSFKFKLPKENIITRDITNENTITLPTEYEYKKPYIIIGDIIEEDDYFICFGINSIFRKLFKPYTKYLCRVYLPNTVKYDYAHILIGIDLNFTHNTNSYSKLKVKQKHGHGKGSGLIDGLNNYKGTNVQLAFVDGGILDEILNVPVNNEGCILLKNTYVGKVCYLLQTL